MSEAALISVLGSTGSIGESTLDVISRHSQDYAVYALSANRDYKKLHDQCLKFKPTYAVIADDNYYQPLKDLILSSGLNTEVLAGESALNQVAAATEVSVVMAAIVGAAGLPSTLAAIDAGKKVLIANKEPLVMAGAFFMQRAHQSGAKILPVDSEHNAIMQCLPDRYDAVTHRKIDGIRRILLTGSGGPFRDYPVTEFADITPAQAVVHPNWQMGQKISVDSATMMNKSLELIEACVLFGVDHSKIEIVIHPQSIIHSMVEYADGSVVAQMGDADMRIPIASALAWPKRIDSGAKSLDFTTLSALEFRPPDYKRYPSLNLVREVINMGGTAPTIMNAANEVAVAAFLEEKIGFVQIVDLVEKTIENSDILAANDLASVIEADTKARTMAHQFIQV